VYGDIVLMQKNWALRGNNANADFCIEELIGTGFSDANVKLTIKAGGNVGIGTVSPFSTAKLQVKTATDKNLAIQTGTTNTTGIKINAFNDAGSANIPLELNGSILSLKTGETERMRITSAGGISFGSTGTAYGTSGQILKSNGNASPTWIDGSAIPGVPAGSGTLNTVPLWTPNGDTLGNSPITISGNNSTFAGAITIGGNLEMSTNNANFADNGKARFGDQADFQIYHNGSNAYIDEVGTGSLYNRTTLFIVQNTDSTKNSIIGNPTADVKLYYNGVKKFETTNTGVSVTGDIQIDSALLSNQENTDVDTGTETVANVAIATYTAAFFDFVIKKTTNVRSGTVYACHDGTTVQFTETSTQDLGNTSDVTLSVDISGGNMRLRATTTSDDWSVKSLIRAI
jgi:hypothetical protein